MLKHRHVHTTHHLLLLIYSHERRKSPLLGLLGTIREGISYECLCVRTFICVYRHAHLCLCACMRLCHLVNTDLGLFGPVGFVVVFETRVDVGSALPLQIPNRDAPRSSSGVETFRSVMSLLLQPSLCTHLEVFSCTLVIC